MAETLKTLLLALSLQAPLAAGLWLMWGSVEEWPLAAVLAGLGYEAVLLLASFGKEVWREELKKDAIKATADWVRGVAHGVPPGFSRRYRKQITSDHDIFNVRGLGLINTYTLKLNRVFVDLRIDASNPQRFNVDLLAHKELEGNRPVWDFLRADSGAQEATALAIIGPPGCGKTTLLQHVAVTLAANRQRRHRVRAYLPVLLSLRDHLRALARQPPPSLATLAQEYFGDQQLFPALRPPPGWFARQLARGRCMVLLDGLDEVPDAEERRRVSAWVDAQIRNYPRCRFVLTARPQGYSDAPLQRAHVLEVQPFNLGQVRRFVDNWYLANEIIASGGRDDAGVRSRARKDAEDLLRRLRSLPSLAALTVNPLLLTMIAMVHRYHGALPGTRVELYAEICEVLLGRWRQARGVHEPMKTSQKLVVLRPLAAHMMERNIRDITIAEAVSVVAEPFASIGVEGAAVEKFLAELQAGSGLLLEREAGKWSFAHLTFQEYLTAAHWLEQKKVDRDWRPLVGDSWWHETLRLYAAQGDATPLVRACLEVDSVAALSLAADFIEEATQLHPDVRRAAEQRLVADQEADDPARRRLAAEVRLSRRLRNLLRISDRCEIDPGFVTCAEYQLFLDDTRAILGQRQPDHWTNYNFAFDKNDPEKIIFRFDKGCANQPVVGVRPEDAVAFCQWLTARQGGLVRYRLPHGSEAVSHPSEVGKVAAWCFFPEGFGAVGLSAAATQAVNSKLHEVSDFPAVHGGLRSFDDEEIITAMVGTRTFSRALYDGADPALNRLLSRALLRTLDRNATSVSQAVSSAITLAIALNMKMEHHLTAGNYYVNRTLADDLAYCLELVQADINMIERYRLPRDFRPYIARAQQMAKALMLESSPAIKKLANLLADVLAVAEAKTFLPLRRAQRQLALRMLEYAYAVIREYLGENDHSLAQSAGKYFSERLELLAECRAIEADVVSLYWRIKMALLREEGELPAWEGIRLVREQEVDFPASKDKG